jgi:hydroxyacylglutathione hydrolase
VQVTPVAILSDNYAWLLRCEATGATAIVDPAEEGPVAAAIEAAGGRLDMILLTHHHDDHIAAVEPIRARFGGTVVGAAADRHRLPPLDRELREGDVVRLGEAEAVVIDTPGHTRGHISFHFARGAALLCGDTLFSLGCGRLLEGSAAEMFASLAKFAALAHDTRVLCGHEYTESNARFALSVDGNNPALRARADEVRALRAAGRPTLPVTLGVERATNPFLRAPDVARLAELRAAKDTFRG